MFLYGVEITLKIINQYHLKPKEFFFVTFGLEESVENVEKIVLFVHIPHFKESNSSLGI